MPSYRCYYLTADDHVVATDFIACETDAEVGARADRLLAAGGYPGIEVWDRGRRVYRARKTGALTAPE